jgi:hypothetical protein
VQSLDGEVEEAGVIENVVQWYYCLYYMLLLRGYRTYQSLQDNEVLVVFVVIEVEVDDVDVESTFQ